MSFVRYTRDMADFIPYQQRYDRPAPREDGRVALSADRWQMLTNAFNADPDGAISYEFLKHRELTVHGPIQVDGILFLPAVYLAA